MIIEIGKIDSLRLIYNTNKIQNNYNRYLFLTKFHWKCIACLDDIYLSFDQVSVTAVYCTKCKGLSPRPNYVTYQYVRVLKERQIELIESFDKDNNVNSSISEAIENLQ